MFDFRLQVFYTAARRLNFTRAASELYITQPAVTRHIRELENQFKTTLFERSGNRRIVLTPAGKTLLRHCEKLFNLYRELEFDMNAIADRQSGVLRIGASMTAAPYILPPVLAGFHERFAEVQVQLTTANTEVIEQKLLDRHIDLGIVEGYSRNPQIRYEEYVQDELVLVSRVQNPVVKKASLKPEELKHLPFLLREPGSGTLDVIAHALKKHELRLSDLSVEMQLGSTESIKSYLQHSDCVAFLSVHSILKELQGNELKIVDIKGVDIERTFYFIEPHGQPAQLAQSFIRFAQTQKKQG
ncbi:MAG: LysR family transcriptional regulator [Mucilaginibacter polytrichastri]|nr:LysR family transcriptional regulator [Mucilaginibacter polytrichastri]